jgi:hypothetical protein
MFEVVLISDTHNNLVSMSDKFPPEKVTPSPYVQMKL